MACELSSENIDILNSMFSTEFKKNAKSKPVPAPKTKTKKSKKKEENKGQKEMMKFCTALSGFCTILDYPALVNRDLV